MVIVVPVLERPHRVMPLLESIRATVPAARVLFVGDPHDHAEHAAIAGAGGELLIRGGRYAEKVNAALATTTEPLIFLGADDLLFHPGWFEAAAARMTAGVGVVGTNDLCNARVIRGEHATHSLVTRDYARLGSIDDPSVLLHEGYPHEFVDDEFIATAMRRSAFVHARDSIVEHLHPMNGKAPMDRLYAGQPARMRVGRRVFLLRRHLWA
jgi:hypothetical protein